MKSIEITPKFFNSLPDQDQREIMAFLRCRGVDPDDVASVIFSERWRWVRDFEVLTYFRDDLTGRLIWDDQDGGPKFNTVRTYRTIAFPRIIRRMLELE